MRNWYLEISSDSEDFSFQNIFYFVVFATAVEYQVILFRPAELTREYIFGTAMLSVATAYFGYETVVTMWKRRI